MKLSYSHYLSWVLVLVLALLDRTSICKAADTPSPAQILQDLKTFNVMGTVLHVAAHPDDENTQLITYLAKGRMYRTAYLSITRGDGGQNLLGSDIFELLGVARTQELLEARKLDGGRQFFTRAIDFGYSKSWEETLNVWDRPQAVGDVVRVIRTFRPDVIITRFSPQSGGHGQHTASAVLSLDAYKVSGDPNAYPEQIAEGLSPWKPKRILLNAGGGGRGGPAPAGAAIQMGVGGTDPATGENYGELSSRSRAMHKTQGFDRAGTGGRGGGARGGGNPMQSFTLMDGEPATSDIMDGVDTTWARVPGGAEIGRMTEAVIAEFKPEDPAASIPALLAIKQRAATLASDPIVNEKREALDRIIQNCLGLTIETTVWPIEVVPGETTNLRHTATLRAAVPVRWMSIGYGATNSIHDLQGKSLSAAAGVTETSRQLLPADTKLTEPYWLRRDPTPGMFVVDEAPLIGQPENPPVFPITHVFEVGGQRLIIRDQPIASPPAGASDREIGRRLDVIAPVAMKFASDVRLFSTASSRQVNLDIVAYRPNLSGTLRIDAPAGWKVEPATLPFKLDTVGQESRFTFTVTAPSEPGSAQLVAEAMIGDRVWNSRRVAVDYRHFPIQLLQPPARTKAVTIDLAIKGKNIAYLPGAGDTVAECLEQMGYTVTQLTGADLTLDRLKAFDALVVGIRAFDTRQDLPAAIPAIMSYVEGGGNVIFQYNRQGVPNQFGPLTLQMSQQRITDEKAAVNFLAPDHPALNTPNKITPADFDGWVQERGIYFPGQWEGFTPLLSFADPNEQPLTGGLLVGQHGKGHLVYTSLVFFRQLPEGVPGAYRLLANLVSLGK